jgi:DNA primase
MWKEAHIKQSHYLAQHVLKLAESADPKTAHVVRVKFDIFKFIMAYENLDFPSAVRRLAERANLPLAEEEFRGGDSDPAFQLKRRLLSLHAETADWFHRHLMKSPEATSMPVRPETPISSRSNAKLIRL